MKCKKVEKMLSSYLDNSLKGADRKKTEVHLAECSSCAKSFHAMTKTDELIKLKAREEPPKEYWGTYWPRLKRKIEESCVTNSFPSRNRNLARSFMPRLAFALSGVLTILLIFTGSLLYRNTQQMRSVRFVLSEKRKEAAYPEVAKEVRLTVTSKQVSEESVRKQAKLFREIKEMFPHTIKWVVTNNGKVEMGLTSHRFFEKAVTREQALIFLQFEIFRASPVSGIVSCPRMIVLSGNEVNAKFTGSSKADKTIYQYRCFPVLKANGTVDLTVGVSLDSSVLNTSLILNEGEKIKLGSLRKGNNEYFVYVTFRSKGLNMVKVGDRKA